MQKKPPKSLQKLFYKVALHTPTASNKAVNQLIQKQPNLSPLSLSPWTCIWGNGETSMSQSMNILQRCQNFSLKSNPIIINSHNRLLLYLCLYLNPTLTAKSALCQHFLIQHYPLPEFPSVRFIYIPFSPKTQRKFN